MRTFLLFSQTRGHLRPEYLGDLAFPTKTALSQGGWAQEAAFLTRAALTMAQRTESWDMSAADECACILLSVPDVEIRLFDCT
jgi:hypothetical protein